MHAPHACTSEHQRLMHAQVLVGGSLVPHDFVLTLATTAARKETTKPCFFLHARPLALTPANAPTKVGVPGRAVGLSYFEP